MDAAVCYWVLLFSVNQIHLFVEIDLVSLIYYNIVFIYLFIYFVKFRPSDQHGLNGTV